MFYLLHGEDEFTNREQLKKLRLGGSFEYNQDTYDGADTDLSRIIMTCDTLPFLSEQRLVAVIGLPKRKRGEAVSSSPGASEPPAEGAESGGTKTKRGRKGGKSTMLTRAAFEKALAEHIPLMPASTVLVVLVDEALEATNPLVKVARQHGKVVMSALPKGAALEQWIAKRARAMNVSIQPDAVSLLAQFIGAHLRLLANELDKLATYVGPGGVIRVEDVRLLSAHVQEARVFDLTDALAQRNRKLALNLLHELLADGEPPIKLISMMISQVRSLLLIKELSQRGMRPAQISSSLGLAPFIVEKAMRQLGHFTLPQLEQTYRQLMTTDAALKRSRMTPEMALDLLVLSFGSAVPVDKSALRAWTR